MPGALEEIERCVEDLGLRGIKLGPNYQNFDPLSVEAERVYAEAERRRIPILFHQGASPVEMAPLHYAHPLAVDQIAIRHPELRIVMADMGHPWQADTVVVIRKHAHVYADVSALYYRPWSFFNGMRLAAEWSVLDKLLLGSDYPIITPRETIDGLRKVNDPVRGTNIPPVPDFALEEIIHRELADPAWTGAPEIVDRLTNQATRQGVCDAPRVWSPATPLANSPEQRRALEARTRAHATPKCWDTRACTVLGAARAKSNNAIATELGVTSAPRSSPGGGASLPRGWNRWARSGRVADNPAPSPRPRWRRSFTCPCPPYPRELTHWSCRTIAKRVGVSSASVQRVWQDHRLYRHRVSTFGVPKDPHSSRSSPTWSACT